MHMHMCKKENISPYRHVHEFRSNNARQPAIFIFTWTSQTKLAVWLVDKPTYNGIPY